MTKGLDKRSEKKVRVISIRLIVTAAAVALISTSVITIGILGERNARQMLNRELEKRLVLEARNLALASSSALLTDFPELTLHPIVRKMKEERSELVMVYVVDHEGVIQGHHDAKRLGTPFVPDERLVTVAPTAILDQAETLLSDDDLIVLKRSVLHPNGQPIGDVYVGLDQGHFEATMMAARRQQLLVLLSILGTAVFLTMILMSRLLRPVSMLRRCLEKIGRGELDVRLKLKSRTELDLLADSINDMAAALRVAHAEQIEKERLEHEMELAREIQRSLLPSRTLENPVFFIDGAQSAAAEVGGDYYDFFSLPDGRVGIVIADVAGKGLGGCLIASMLAVLMRTLKSTYSSPSDLILALDKVIIDSLRPSTFITMFYGLLDPSTAILTYASAGHNPVLHYKAGAGEIEWRKTEGIPLGLVKTNMLQKTLSDCTLQLAPGDLVLQTTDGFNEAVNPKMLEYGFDRIADTVKSHVPRGFSAVIDALQRSVIDWEAGLPASDDKTVVAIGRTPAALDADKASRPIWTTPMSAELEALWLAREAGDHFSFPAELAALDAMGSWLRQREHLLKMQEGDSALIEQGVFEVVANIVEHGCMFDTTKTIDVWFITHEVTGERCATFIIRDHGKPPKPNEWKLTNNMRKVGRGYGLELIDKIVTKMEFHPNTPQGNLTMVKILRSSE